ncbi:MAG: ribonuclease P protein component 2 [Nanoarchaeota archaeon]|nr:ribonuclease P protein component 2 [Nanoarchaeota archaeon]
MIKNKPLLPTLKEKKRYVVFEVISKSDFDKEKLFSAIQDSLLRLIGTLGAGQAGLSIIKKRYDEGKKRGIAKVNNLFVDKFRMAMALIKEIDGKKVIVRTVGVSGILKQAQKKYMV